MSYMTEKPEDARATRKRNLFLVLGVLGVVLGLTVTLGAIAGSVGVPDYPEPTQERVTVILP